ncbi:unnamed protein product [Schistosoma spindalis]|nr:unnamed protein product [Schistosoma spindale]
MSKLPVFARTLVDMGHKRVRKNPRVHPKAKGKFLKVRQPTPVDPVEDALSKKWWVDYRLQYEAVRSLFQYEINRHKMEAISASRTDHEHERNRRHELTETWNKETFLLATDKFEKLLKALIDKQTDRLIDFQNKQAKSLDKLKADLDTVAGSTYSSTVISVPHLMSNEKLTLTYRNRIKLVSQTTLITVTNYEQN